MRREELYLRDIVESAAFVEQFIRGLGREAFDASELIRSAVSLKLMLIGEAAAHISDELRVRYAEIPWVKIVAFRNILIHSYFGIDWNEVWRTATAEVPVLALQVVEILTTEFREGGTDGDSGHR